MLLRTIPVVAVLVATLVPPGSVAQEAHSAIPLDDPFPQLLHRFPELRLDSVPLETALEVLADRAKVNIRVKWPSLGATGVGRSTPVTVRAYDVPLYRALRLVLDAATGPVPLDYTVRGNVIVVSTEDETPQRLVTRLYDVRDLVRKQVEWAGLHDPPVPLRAGVQYVNTPPPSAHLQALEDLVSVIEESVSYDSWTDNGGTNGRVRQFAGILIITNSADAHAQIERFLAGLRKSALSPIPGPGPATRPSR